MNEAVSLSLFVYGLAAVVAIGAALLIKGVVLVLGWLDRPSMVAAPASASAAVAAQPEDVIPAHHLVVIAAAAHAVFGTHRLLHIGHARVGPVWSAEGRLAQHNAHHPSGHH